ncbi:MAG TPA: hypothetical protein VNW96_24040 [Mycobacterium sp.]|jgi:uncharacterized protein YukE|nr:hypothetical protein [Mycobacterium sp.]
MPLVDQDAVQTAANGFEGQMHAACDVLQRYLASVNNVNAPGSWRGPAVQSSTVTGEEIHSAQRRLQAKFELAIQTLRGNVHGFGDVDAQSTSNLQSVTSHISLRHV